jgi:FixJ family two-component response regulator
MKYRPTVLTLDLDACTEELVTQVLMDKPIHSYAVNSLESLRKWLGRNGVSWDHKNATEIAELFADQLPYPCCMIADAENPRMNVEELQSWLRANGICIPVLFLVATTPSSLQNILATTKLGAFEFIFKPIDKLSLIKAIEHALQWDHSHRHEWVQCVRLRIQLDSLTDRETQVLRYLSRCKSVKQIASLLGTSPNTIRNQRVSIRKKLEASSDAELTEFLMLFRIYLEPCTPSRHYAVLPRLEGDLAW